MREANLARLCDRRQSRISDDKPRASGAATQSKRSPASTPNPPTHQRAPFGRTPPPAAPAAAAKGTKSKVEELGSGL